MPSTARLIRRAPSDPPNATTTAARRAPRARPGLRPGPPGSRRTPAICGRTGVPVTTARGNGVPSQPTALAAANLPSSRLAAPGTASTLTSTSGTRCTRAPTEPARLA